MRASWVWVMAELELVTIQNQALRVKEETTLVSKDDIYCMSPRGKPGTTESPAKKSTLHTYAFMHTHAFMQTHTHTLTQGQPVLGTYVPKSRDPSGLCEPQASPAWRAKLLAGIQLWSGGISLWKEWGLVKEGCQLSPPYHPAPPLPHRPCPALVLQKCALHFQRVPKQPKQLSHSSPNPCSPTQSLL